MILTVLAVILLGPFVAIMGGLMWLGVFWFFKVLIEELRK